MTRWGIGPIFGIYTACYSILMYWINTLLPTTFIFPFQIEIGISLIIIGFILFIYPAITIDKYFNEGKLRTNGMYKICRHPIYVSWILIIIPGIVLCWGSIIGLSIPLYSYLVFRSFIYKEENYLANKFNSEYFTYKSSINVIFPKIKIL